MAHSPPSSQFSFTAPFPPLKQRRVSLGLPPTAPRVSCSFRDDTSIAGPSNPLQDSESDSATHDNSKDFGRGKMRKTEITDSTSILEKKPRKKWSAEETQMLVDGCNSHGVGNWKTILSDPNLKFDNRSPVDLKDRFRTYFPDAYKKHYPNARTHLSSKVRSTLPDGSPLFEKTRSKRRRPFTEEEDRALRVGYEKHGTIWATIVKDPIFQEQNRRSTDLRDRFRNAFPDLYQAAGYKPRNNISKRKKDLLIEGSRMPQRAATDDQLALSSTSATGPARGARRRAHTSQGILLRGGTKSVPQSNACSEDEDSSGLEDEDGEMSSGITTNVPKATVIADNTSITMHSRDRMKNGLGLNFGANPSADPFPPINDDDDEMDMRLISLEPLAESLADYPTSTLDGMNQHRQTSNSVRRSGIHTPTHSHHPWSSPRSGSNNINDGGGGGGGGSNPGVAGSNTSTHSSHINATSSVKIGQSAWGAQDWFSPNPRLDHSFTGIVTNGGTNPNNNGSSTGTGTPSSYFSPSSPFSSFNLTPLNATHPLTPVTNTNSLIGGLTTLNIPMNYVGHNHYPSHQHHGVIERYDLWPPSSSALASSSSFSAMGTANSSSGWSGFSGSGTSGPGSIGGFSSSFGGDISSEVSFGDAQSTFSDEGVFDGSETFGGMGDGVSDGIGNSGTAMGSFRAITHHSDYAGDLIFGARGYGGGGFGWFGNPYAPAVGPANGNDGGSGGGLGLVGIDNPKDREKNNEGIAVVVAGGEIDGIPSVGEPDKESQADGKTVSGTGSVNPMQLHTPSGSFSGIDEIELAGITLNDSRDVDVDGDDTMEGTGTRTGGTQSESGLGLNLTALPAPLQLQRESHSGSSHHRPSRIGNRNRASTSSSVSAGTSPARHRLDHPRSGTMTPLNHDHDLHSQGHPDILSHSHHHHSHSFGQGTATLPSKFDHYQSSPFGRFSLDDLDLVDSGPDMNTNNLTPPATPMMQHAQQLRGMRRYSVFGLGLGSSGPGLGVGQPFNQGQALSGGMGGPQTPGQGQGGRSISVPPSEARNSLGMSFIPIAGAESEGGERGRSAVSGTSGVSVNANSANAGGSEDIVIAAPSGVTVKRSLSSTVHHSHGAHGPGHGHSLSTSTLPPFPSHSEIWRSSTPTAKGSRNGSLNASGNNLLSNAGGGSSTNTLSASVASLFNTPPPTIFSPSPAFSTGANGDFTNPDLPFLDLHYWHQQNQGAAGQGQSVLGPMMVDSTEEARQALDLAEPFMLNGHGHWQGFGFVNASNSSGVAGNTTTSSASAGTGAGGGLKTFLGGVLPSSLSRHMSPFTARQSQGQHGHQRGQSHQVVNPKDLVLNADAGVEAGAASGGAMGRMDNKRKRASWDGGLV